MDRSSCSGAYGPGLQRHLGHDPAADRGGEPPGAASAGPRPQPSDARKLKHLPCPGQRKHRAPPMWSGKEPVGVPRAQLRAERTVALRSGLPQRLAPHGQSTIRYADSLRAADGHCVFHIKGCFCRLFSPKTGANLGDSG